VRIRPASGVPVRRRLPLGRAAVAGQRQLSVRPRAGARDGGQLSVLNPMSKTTAHSLDVPGARLHYEVCGSGPTLLLIPGGMADGEVFAGIVPLLADAHTVVTYDPRGLSRSTIDDPDQDVQI